MGVQDFGSSFSLAKLLRARDVARDITFDLSSQIIQGMTEDDAHLLYKEICKKHPVEKQWHPPKIRFGPNTLKNFKEISEPYVLKEEDIFFIDIGPVVEGHEADYGQTFCLGDIYEEKLIADCSEKIFHEVASFWLKEKATGPALYHFAKSRADHYGLFLNMGNDGHRIGDFPHHIHFKGSLPDVNESIMPNAWILEIHLFNPDRKFGAFYEDILTDQVVDT